ncbi:MAG: hypothetical protein COB36_11550 [Alphaproteobacteria bacterium]|nr:MAG: hypothetical protein COB36_11550 [Alphaproteobacteria bacterium]
MIPVVGGKAWQAYAGIGKMADFKHGVRYEIGKHQAPECVDLNLWTAGKCGSIAGIWQYSKANGWSVKYERECKRHETLKLGYHHYFSLYPVVEQQAEPKSARDEMALIMAEMDGKTEKLVGGESVIDRDAYDGFCSEADNIIKHLFKRGYELKYVLDEDQMSVCETDRMLRRLYPPKPDQRDVQQIFNKQHSQAISDTMKAQEERELRRGSKPPTWQRYLDEDGDFVLSDNADESWLAVVFSQGETREWEKPMRDFLNHKHPKEA